MCSPYSRPNLRPRWRSIVLVLLACFGLLRPAGFGMAQTPLPDSAWTLDETDCIIARGNWRFSETHDEFRSAPACQQIHVNAGYGTRILTSRRVQPAWVIDELKPALWIKARRPHVRLYARVVLPKTEDPLEDGPMTVLLPGPEYVDTGRWQKLDFADLAQSLPELLERAVWKLRARYDRRIDDQQAYIDRLVLNVYSGSGANTVWVDDVSMPGAIEIDGDAAVAGTSPSGWPVRQASWQEETTPGTRRPALARCNSTILEVRGQPFFARIIQHNGESFELLRDLGFNTVELSRPATIQQLRQAESLDLWLVCPAPESAGVEPISADYDRVLAWKLDTDPYLPDVNLLANRVQEIRHSDFRTDRPVVVFANTHLYELARVSDILSVGFEPVGGSFVLGQYSDWVEQRTRLARRNMPVWATVQTELPATISRQTAALAATTPPTPLEAAQIRFMAYEAAAGGARGMRFVSRSRLDAADPVARLRSVTLRWLNAHLRHLEPWVCGGAVVNREESDDGRQQLTTLSTPLGRLILIQRASNYEQWAAGDAEVSVFRFSDPSLGTSEQPYHLSENGLILLDQGRLLSGNEITIEHCGPLEAVMITDQPAVINRMAETYMLAGDRAQAEMHLEIVRQWLAIAQLINEQLARMGQGLAPASGAINEANNAAQLAGMLVAGDSAMTANQRLHEADQKLAAARREILQASRSLFSSRTSSPLLAHISLVPLHFDLLNRIDPSRWQANGLAGGDFENLDHMTAHQWENHRATMEGIRTHVELASGPAVRGESSLLLRVQADGAAGSPPLVDRTPLWIQSAEVPVRAGQLVRIHGWVRIPQPVSGSLEGLRIVDSIGGHDLAERITRTSGWQEFTMYRCPSTDTRVRLTFEMTGLGEAWIDEVTINTINLSGSSSATLQTNRAGDREPASPAVNPAVRAPDRLPAPPVSATPDRNSAFKR